MKNLNVLEKLNTESGRSMAATALGGFLGAVTYVAAGELKKCAIKLYGLAETSFRKLQNRKEVEVNPANEVAEE